MEIEVNGIYLDVDYNETIPLNYSITDISDIASRSADHTKTFNLKSTPKNDAVFGYFFEPSRHIAKELNLLDSNNMYAFFNPQKTLDCRLLQDGALLIDGELKLMQVNSTNGVVSYDVVVYSKLGGFYSKLRNPNRTRLQDLPLGADVAYGTNVIDDSFNNYPTENVAFPYINYGNNILPDYPFYNVRPAFKVKNLVDLIFAASGYTYTCPFFNTDFFGRLYIPNNQERLTQKGTKVVDAGTIVTNSFNGGISSNIEGVEVSGSTLRDFTTTNDIDFEYTGTASIKVDISITINANVDVKKILGSTLGAECALWLNTNSLVLTHPTTAGIDFLQDFNGSFTLTAKDVQLVTNDIIKVEWIAFGSLLGSCNVSYQAGSSLLIESKEVIDIPIVIGDDIILKDVIPQGVYCDDFITSIFKMFNLYVRPSKTINNHLDILTYAEYYNNAPQIDWSTKVDNLNFEIIPTTLILPSIFNFKYKSDSDYLNELYNKKFNEGYGDLTWNNSLGNEEYGVELIFSATPDYAETSDPLITSGIFKQEKATGVMSATSSNIRIVQLRPFNHTTTIDFLDNQASDTTAGSSIAAVKDMVLASMWDDPLVPLNGQFFESLCFASPNQLFYNTGTNSTFNIGLYSSFYSAYVAELTDASSIVLTCNIYLNEIDIMNLDFRATILVNGVMYRLLSIEDFDLANTRLAKCKLLKIVDINY